MHCSDRIKALGMLFAPVLLLLCLQNLLVASSPVRLLLAEVLGRHFETLPTTLETRIETIDNTDLAERDLSKRQCVAGTNAKGNPIFVCDGLVVSIQDILDKFNEKGYAAGRITMFYTALSSLHLSLSLEQQC